MAGIVSCEVDRNEVYCGGESGHVPSSCLDHRRPLSLAITIGGSFLIERLYYYAFSCNCRNKRALPLFQVSSQDSIAAGNEVLIMDTSTYMYRREYLTNPSGTVSRQTQQVFWFHRNGDPFRCRSMTA